VITQEQAAAIAFHVCGAPPSDPRRGWDLTEFDAGWLITARAASAPTRVIDRDTGRVVSFPSSVAASRITGDYQQALRSAGSTEGGADGDDDRPADRDRRD